MATKNERDRQIDACECACSNPEGRAEFACNCSCHGEECKGCGTAAGFGCEESCRGRHVHEKAA
jgi:hypothetical protein